MKIMELKEIQKHAGDFARMGVRRSGGAMDFEETKMDLIELGYTKRDNKTAYVKQAMAWEVKDRLQAYKSHQDALEKRMETHSDALEGFGDPEAVVMPDVYGLDRERMARILKRMANGLRSKRLKRYFHLCMKEQTYDRQTVLKMLRISEEELARMNRELLAALRRESQKLGEEERNRAKELI